MSKNETEKQRIVSTLPDGYTARPATMADAEAVTALFNSCSQALIGRNVTSVDEILLGWKNPGFDMAYSTYVVFSPAGRLIGYIPVWDTEDQIRIFSEGCVHPSHKELGIESHLIEWAEARARRSVPKAPEGARVVLINRVLSEDRVSHETLGQHGFEIARYFLRMEIRFDGPPPTPEWPEGIAIRAFVPEQDEWLMIRAVHEAFKDHWGHVERPLDEVYKDWMYMINEDPDFDPTLWFMAMDGDQVAGAAACWLNDFASPELSEVMALAVRRPWRRQGLGLALLYHAFGEFYRRGQAGAILGVDAGSLTGATRLYEKAGMQIAFRRTIFEKELRPGEDLSTQSLDQRFGETNDVNQRND